MLSRDKSALLVRVSCKIIIGRLRLSTLDVQAIASEPGGARQEPVQEPTGLPLATLQWVGRSIARTPPEFTLHPEVDRLCQARRWVGS